MVAQAKQLRKTFQLYNIIIKINKKNSANSITYVDKKYSVVERYEFLESKIHKIFIK